MRNRLVLTVVTVILVLSAVAVPMYSSEAVDGGTDVLIDHGNGDTEWAVSQGETVWDTLLWHHALSGMGLRSPGV